jgi:hypothetical protein
MGKPKRKTLSPEACARIDATVNPLVEAFQAWLTASPLAEERGRAKACLYDDEKALMEAFNKWESTLLFEIDEVDNDRR